MKIVTYNVNGLRARVQQHRGLRRLLDALDADIVCFQETKLARHDITEDVATAENYESFFSFARGSKRGRVGYSGVATFCRTMGSNTSAALPLAADEGFTGLLHCDSVGELGDTKGRVGAYEGVWAMEGVSRHELLQLDTEGRCIVTDHGAFVLFNFYGPRVEPGDEERFRFKLLFYAALQRRWEALLSRGRRVIAVGDYNIAPAATDSCSPGSDFDKNPCRQWLNSMLPHTGGPFHDVFRSLHPDRKEAYTCWSQASGAEEFNYGVRIDLILAAGPCCHFVEAGAFQVSQDCRGRRRGTLTESILANNSDTIDFLERVTAAENGERTTGTDCQLDASKQNDSEQIKGWPSSREPIEDVQSQVISNEACMTENKDSCFTESDKEHNLVKCDVTECDIMLAFKRMKADGLPRWLGGRSLRLEGSDHAPVYVRLTSPGPIVDHEIPSLAARYLPELHGRQLKLVEMLHDKVRPLSEEQVALHANYMVERQRKDEQELLKGTQTCSTVENVEVAAEERSLLIPEGSAQQAHERMKGFNGSSDDKAHARQSCQADPIDFMPSAGVKRPAPRQSSLSAFFGPRQGQVSGGTAKRRQYIKEEGQLPSSNDHGSTLEKVVPGGFDTLGKDSESQPEPLWLLQEIDELSNRRIDASAAATAEWQRIQRSMLERAPVCKGHRERCVGRMVKKAGANIGRGFYVCARAKGPPDNPEARCDHFEWAASKRRGKGRGLAGQ